MQTELEKYLDQIIPIIVSTLGDSNNDLLTCSLTILHQGFRNVDPVNAS